MESPNDTAKIELKDGNYIVHVKGAKGEETYTIAASKVKAISIQGGGENSVDTTALQPTDLGKIIIGDKAPKWAADMLKNLPTFIPPAGDGGGDHNLQGATTLVNEIIKATKTGEWKGVTDFLKTDSKMLQPGEANDIIRKTLSSLCEPVISKIVDRAGKEIEGYAGDRGRLQYNTYDDIGFFGCGAKGIKIGGWWGTGAGASENAKPLAWNRYYAAQVHVRGAMGPEVVAAKRSAIDLSLPRLNESDKKQIIDTVKVLPVEIRQLMLAGLTSENGELWMGDRFSTSEWREIVNASLAS